MKVRKLMADDQKKTKDRLKRHQVLGNLVRAFNSWRTDTALPKRWTIAPNEDFPVIEGGDESSNKIAAE
jgi:hypothetical protein